MSRVSFYRKRRSDIATYCSMDSGMYSVLKRHSEINGRIASWTHLWTMETFHLSIEGQFEGSVTPSLKQFPIYPTGSCSLHEIIIQKTSGFAAKNGQWGQWWNIYADLYVITILTVLQRGYSKFCCFWCEWDGRERGCHCRTNKGHSFMEQQQLRGMWHILL